MCVFSKNRSEAAQRRAGAGLDNYDKTAPKQMVLKHGIEQKTSLFFPIKLALHEGFPLAMFDYDGSLIIGGSL